MKKLIIALSIFAAGVVHAGWEDDWFDQQTSSSGGSYENEERGFYSAGSFTGRYRMTNDQLVTVSPPRLEVGCGGIDLFAGGLSYLDPEYIVEKLERIVQAAPAFAFQIAMQEYCKACETVMTTLEKAAAAINSTQLNDCRASKKLAVAIAKPGKETWNELKTEALATFSLDQGLRKNSQDVQEAVKSGNGSSPEDTQQLLAGCPQLFKDVFTNGSVLENTANKLGIGGYAPVMRGLIGDAVVSYNASTKVMNVETMPHCSGNDNIDPSDFLTGAIDVMDANGSCSGSGYTPVITTITNMLTSIAGKMGNGANTPFTAAEIAFIQASPLPVKNILRDAQMGNNVNAQISILAEPLSMKYAQQMLTDLQRVMQFVVAKANEISTDGSAPTNAGDVCEVAMVKEAINHFEQMTPKVSELRANAQINFSREMAELQSNIVFTQQVINNRQRQLNAVKTGQ